MKKVILKSGEEIAYREVGTGSDILVCIHGNMCSGFEFVDLMDSLSDKNLRVISPDLRGFGESSYNNPVSSFKEYADDIMEMLDILGVAKLNILGHYIGGAIAMEIAISLKTRINKLFLVSSVGTQGYPMQKLDQNGQPIPNEYLSLREEIEEDKYRVLPVQQIFDNKDFEFLGGVFESILFNTKMPDNEKVKSILEDAFTQKSITDIYCALSSFNISNKPNGVLSGNNKIEEITAETFVIQGSNDSLVPFDMAYSIKYSLKSKSKIITGNFGHSPFLDCPNWICETVLNNLI